MRTTTLALLLVPALGCGDPVIDAGHLDVLTILSVEPLSGPSTGGTTVTLHVRAACDTPSVHFDDRPATAVRTVSAGIVTAKAPPHPIGAAEITVVCGAGASLPFEAPFAYSAAEIVFADRVAAPPLAGHARAVDIDGDRLDDLVMLEPEAHRAAIYLANGIDGFSSEPAIVVAVDAALDLSMALVDPSDISGDGRPDLTIAVGGTEADVRLRTITAKSDDGYASPEVLDFPISELFEVVPIAAFDIDGDRRPDPLVAERVDYFDTTIALHLTRSGARLELAAYSSSGLPRVTTGDFDQDGRLDLMLIVATVPFAGLHVMGADDPTPVSFSVDGFDTFSVHRDDDAWPDLMARGDPRSDDVEIRRGLGPGLFAGAEVLAVACAKCNAPAAVSSAPADFDGNGIVDQVFTTLEGLYFVELDSERAELVAAGGAYIGGARLVRGQRPAILYATDTLRAAAVSPPAPYPPGSDARLDAVPALLDSTGWSCFGEFEGRRIALAPSATDPTTLLVRDAMPGAPFDDVERMPMPAPLDAELGFCLPARFGDDPGGFLVLREHDPILVRILRDGGIVATASPVPTATGRFYGLTRPDHRGGVGLARLTPASHARTFQRLALDGDTLVLADEVPFGLEGAAVIALFDADDEPDVIAASDGLPAYFGRRANDGTLEFDRRHLAPALTGVAEVRTADVDGDGDWDLLARTIDELVIFENDGAGGIVERARQDAGGVTDFVAGCNFDGDPHVDILAQAGDVTGIVRRTESPVPFMPLDLWKLDGLTSAAVPLLDTCSDVDADGLDDIVHFEALAATTKVFYNRSR